MILQLNPTILVDTPLGKGQTIFIIDYGMHQNTCWIVALVDMELLNILIVMMLFWQPIIITD